MKLTDDITKISRLNEFQKKALKKLGISTVEDLLYHFPTRYGDTSETKNIASLQKGELAVVFGKISGLKTSKGFKSKIPMADGYVEDESGRIHCVWFNQPYLAKMTSEDALVRIEGKISQRKNEGELYFSNPKIEVINKLPLGVGESLFGSEGESHTLYPVYAESRGITSNWMYHKIVEIFKSGILDEIIDPIPDEIIKRYSLPGIKTALIWIHTPMKKEDAEAARKRFAFEEVFLIQLEKQKARKEYEKNPSFPITPDEKHMNEFIKRFPFQATKGQLDAIQRILDDFKKDHAMSRLLEGDVGSGKTAVAASTAYATVTTRPQKNGVIQNFGNLQVAYMCPTEILATQHFESFIAYFSYLGIQVGLITGNGCKKFPSKLNPKGWTDISRTQLLKWVASGEIPILIGTHALIQKAVKFKNLAYVIIDEQHRFGTRQRANLVQKELQELVIKSDAAKNQKAYPQASELSEHRVPHLLSMTATPIPRTLALTIYGDLDLTVLSEMPHGRRPIITEIVRPDERDSVYEKIREELRSGRQAYVICPRINEPDPTKEAALLAKSVKEEAKRLKQYVFKEYNIGILHSKMKPAEKDRVMLDFKNGIIHILCATSVVEVGINVPNATVIILEGAERFGLAQLHQLRGRVIRSNNQAYCYVFAETKSDKTVDRLMALKTAKNGFELAEYDLKLRGSGELSGIKQWGVSDIAMEALQNLKMVEAARNEAQRMVEEDETFASWPHVQEILKHRRKDQLHFE